MEKMFLGRAPSLGKRILEQGQIATEYRAL
jgi:hypothetical protein